MGLNITEYYKTKKGDTQMSKKVHIPKQLEQHLTLIADLIPYDKNPRKHNKKSIEELMKSIQLDGFVVPILIDQKSRIIAGHKRRLAALELRMEKIPAVKIQCTEEEYLRLVISDNRMSELSTWNKTLFVEVAELLQGLNEAELIIPGFSDEDLDKMFNHSYKETLETVADFGESGEVDAMDEATRVTSMTFKLNVKDHKKIKATIGAIMRENDFETTGEALVLMSSKFAGPTKTVRRNA